MHWNTFISTCRVFKSKWCSSKNCYFKNLEGELKEQEERFTDVSNPDYDAFTKIERSIKKQMEQIGENLMKNLLIELKDSKREMEEKLKHAVIQIKSYAESVGNTSQEKSQTPNKTYIDFRAIMEEISNAELAEEKEKKMRSKNLIIHGVKNLLLTTRVTLSNLTISI